MAGNLGATVAIVAGSGALVGGALFRVLVSYLTARRSDVRVTLTTESGERIELNATKVADAEALVQAFLAAHRARVFEVDGEADK